MKKSMAALSALLIGLSNCPPGAVAIAMEYPKSSLEDERSFADEALQEENESLFEDQALTEKEENLSADQTLLGKNNKSLVEQPYLDDESSFAERLWKKITDIGEIEDLQTGVGNETQQEDERGEQRTVDAKTSELKNLQIPQKMGIVIDPWEMDGKGQVYSDVYVIRNTGDTPGVLTLSNLVCRPREQSGVIVKSDKDGLHDSSDKYIYMEMLFGNGDRIIFSSEKSQYQTELKPGEELSVSFIGEVNENAFAKWTDQDVAISVVYSWEAEEAKDSLTPEEQDEEQANVSDEDGLSEQEVGQQTDAGREESADHQQTEASEEESADRQQTDTNEEERPAEDQQTDTGEEESTDTLQADSGIDDVEDEQKVAQEEESNLPKEAGKESLDIPQTDIDQENVGREDPDAVNEDTQQDSSVNINTESKRDPAIDYNMEAGQTGSNPEIAVEELQTVEETVSPDKKEKEEIMNVELLESHKADIKIESWKTDEKGRIVSPQYLLFNAGDTAGTWILSDLICKPQVSSEVRVITDKKGLYDSEDKSVYMELVLGNGEKMVLSQESSTYEVKLEPGEKLVVRFIGEANGNLFESQEEGDITVTAVGSWNRD